MSSQRHFRSSGNAIGIRGRLVFFVLIAIFAARSAPAVFLGATTEHSIAADSRHDQRPRFNSRVLAWTAPIAAFVLFPADAEPLNLAAAQELFLTLQTKGFHFNRPPPIS
jgi:hypothetical protein